MYELQNMSLEVSMETSSWKLYISTIIKYKL